LGLLTKSGDYTQNQIVGEMAILQQLSCESSHGQRSSSSGKVYPASGISLTTQLSCAQMHGGDLICRSDVMRWRNQNGAAVFIVLSNAFFTNEILKKEPKVRLLENSLQQAD
jgi:hypothetical protein